MSMDSTYKRIFILIYCVSIIGGALYHFTVLRGQPIAHEEGFIRRSEKSLFDLSFYASERPFTSDLFFKLCGSNPEYAVAGQKVMSLLCWSILGLAAAALVPGPAARIVFYLLFFSLQFWWNIAAWNCIIRSESLSFSFFAAWLACVLFFLHKPSAQRLILLSVISLFFSFIRDNLPYSVLLFALLLAVIAFICRLKQYKKYFTAYIMIMVVIFVLQSISCQVGKRHQFPLINVIFQRILPDEKYTQWFIEKGLPADDTLLRWKGKWGSSNDFALYRDGKYDKFMDWTLHEGKYVYAYFLLSHPRYTITTPLLAKDKLLSYNLFQYTYYNYPKDSRLSNWIDMVFLVLYGLLNFPAAIGLTLVSLYCFIKQREMIYSIPTLLTATFLFNAMFIYHADAMEVSRHSLMNVIAFQTISCLALLLVYKQYRGGKRT